MKQMKRRMQEKERGERGENEEEENIQKENEGKMGNRLEDGLKFRKTKISKKFHRGPESEQNEEDAGKE